MRAVGVRRFGGPEVLEVVELDEPVPSEGEVRVRVAAATVNPTDVGLRMGRWERELSDRPPPWVPGMELAGEIDAVGPGAGWSVGDRVMAIVLPTGPHGGAQAATLPMNGLTVRLALDLLALDPGQTLALTGAAGAVGGYAIELGKLEGLTVLAVAAPGDEALVRDLGADIVVPRGERCVGAILDAVPGGVDGVIDAALLNAAILPAVRDGGSLAAVRAFEGESERGITIHQVFVREYAANQAALAVLGELAEAGRLTLRVAQTVPPERAGDAHRMLEAGGVRGRLLIAF